LFGSALNLTNHHDDGDGSDDGGDGDDDRNMKIRCSYHSAMASVHTNHNQDTEELQLGSICIQLGAYSNMGKCNRNRSTFLQK